MPLDAIVIGSGPNGLVAANLLADAGWDVLVVEAQDVPGGAVRTGELTVPGYRHDLFSAFYPLAAASPVIARLGLEDHGLRWRRAPLALAHPTPDGKCAVIAPDVDRSAASVDAYHHGDGQGWHTLMARYARHGQAFVNALLDPFPPIRSGLRLAAQLGWRGGLDFARLGVISARRLSEEHFSGAGGALLLAGNALHTDLSPETAASGLFGWLLCGMGQHVGFPVPEGGAGELTAAMVHRLHSRGGELRCGTEVERVITSNGRATGVRTAAGEEIGCRRAVLADVTAPLLYRTLLAEAERPPELMVDLDRFEWDPGTVKVDWALSAPIPWSAPDAREAGTLHLADDLNELTRWAADLATRTVPARPFLLVGQQSMTDPSRQPPGAETAWAYTHVPRRVERDGGGHISGSWDDADTEAMVERVEQRMEEQAPGFRRLIVGRHVFTPRSLPLANQNLDGGAINGGTSQLHQQAVLRPFPGTGRPDTFIEGLFLASSSAHPGGGVHGACGANAAGAALAAARTPPIARRVLRRLSAPAQQVHKEPR